MNKGQNTGSVFYICEDHYLLIYETRDAIVNAKQNTGEPASMSRKISSLSSIDTIPTPAIRYHVARRSSDNIHVATSVARYWEHKLKSKVVFCLPKEPIFVIEKQNIHWHVIIGNKIGWIEAANWLELKELVNK